MWSNNLITGPHRSGFGFLGHSVIVGNVKVSIGLFMCSIPVTVGFSIHTKKKTSSKDTVIWQILKVQPQLSSINSYLPLLTLASVTSERARQVRGGGSGSPPLSILAPEQILAQKSCFPKSWHQFQLIWHLFRIFFQKSPKTLAKIQNLSKNC